MAQILNGTLPQIVGQTKQIVFIDSTGKELSSGVQIINGSLADIVGQCKLVMFISPSGTDLY